MKVFMLLVSFYTFVHSMHMKIECESQEMNHWGLGNLMTCIMSKNTTIHCPGAIVEWNPQVRAISLCMNSEIHFLPSDLHSSFSDLNLIYAYKSAIQAISRENFRNLTKLKTLDLDQNQITEIPRGTFSDLISLRELYMQGNGLKFIDAYDFRNLKHLELVYFGSNECISQSFHGNGRGDGLETKVAIAVASSCGMKDDIELIDALTLKNDLEKDLIRLEERLKCEAMNILPENEDERNATSLTDLQEAISDKLAEFENLKEVLEEKQRKIHKMDIEIMKLRRDNDILRYLKRKEQPNVVA